MQASTYDQYWPFPQFDAQGNQLLPSVVSEQQPEEKVEAYIPKSKRTYKVKPALPITEEALF